MPNIEEKMSKKEMKAERERCIDKYISLFNEYFVPNDFVVKRKLAEKFGYDSIEKLREAEYNCAFGFDCGWVNVWKSEFDESLFSSLEQDLHIPYPSQSTTLVKAQLEMAIEAMDMEKDGIMLEVHLD